MRENRIHNLNHFNKGNIEQVYVLIFVFFVQFENTAMYNVSVDQK